MIYLDSGAIIRLVEGVPTVRVPMESRLAAIRADVPFVATSRLSRLECRTKPMREKDGSLLSLYDAFFQGRELMIIEIGPSVIEKATEIRANFGLKAPDAIHAASAILAAAAEFWTSDQGFRRCPELNVMLFPAV